jgi:hypothetical protein
MSSDSYEAPYVNDEHELLGLIRQNPALLAKLEEETGRIGSFLKSGANGSVYEVADHSQVLKLTADEIEANAANTLLHRPMPEAVTVYGVWELPQVESEDITGCWAILMERLEPLDGRDAEFIRAWSQFRANMGATSERVDEFEEAFKGKFKPHLMKWLRSAIENLEDRGIVNRDMHKKNVMRRKNGQLAIIDMGGNSEVPETDIQKLAAMFEVMAGRIEVLADGGIYGRLMFCLKQYPRSFDHILHIVTTAIGQPEVYRALQYAKDNDKTQKDSNRYSAELVVLKNHESELSRSYPWAKYIPWVAKELADPKFGETTAIVSFLLGSFKQFFEYVRKLPSDVSKLKIVDVVNAIKEHTANGPELPPPQGETVYTYGDKWTIQKITTKEQLDAEGELLEHCVGSYFDEVSDGLTSIYSLRDPEGFPHVTIEYRDKQIVQIQAKGNEFPRKHIKRLREMVMKVFDGNVVARIMLKEDPKTLPLAGANLRGADLQEANLQEANLKGANLLRANLQEADLRGANLQEADLIWATLKGANLKGANLLRANLRGADLQEVIHDNTTKWPEGYVPDKRAI